MAAAVRTRAILRATYVTPQPHQDADFHTLKAAWDASLLQREDDLPCGKCTVYDEEKVVLGANAACKAQDLALLCISAEFHHKGSNNQQSIGFRSLDLIRAYGERKKLMSLDNCKVTNSLRSTMKGTFQGASVDLRKGASFHACARGYKVLERRPLGRPDPAVRRIPTPEGWVYIRAERESLTNPIQETHWVFTLMYDRAECSTCQAGV